MLLKIMSLKMIVLSCATGVVVLGGAGFGIYKYISAKDGGKNSGTASVSDEKITGKQADGKNVEVNSAHIDASPINFGTEEMVDAGYTSTTSLNLYSDKKMSKVAFEELEVANLEALGDCTTSEKDASVSTYIPGAQQAGYIRFKLTCRTGVSYSVRGVLDTTGEWSGLKLLSYGGLTPSALARSLVFDVAVKFDDGTITKKSFSATISGQKLWNGDFGAGTISGEKEKF